MKIFHDAQQEVIALVRMRRFPEAAVVRVVHQVRDTICGVMPIAALVLMIAFAGGGVAAARPAMFQPARDGGCVEWRTCRDLALAAAERGEYATFHDLAWRAVQTGPPKDPALMYLLARAQALSGRPHDALIMLQRLAEMGMASDAATNEDFNRVRELRDWPAVETRIAAAGSAIPTARPPAPTAAPARPPASAAAPARPPASAAAPARPPVVAPVSPPAAAAAPARPPVVAPVSPPAAAAAPAPPPPAAVAAPAPPPPAAAAAEPAPAAAAPLPPSTPPASTAPTPSPAAPSVAARALATQAVRFSTKQFAVSGLAYDAPSRRFVLGDRLGRRLIVVDESSSHAIDLVRADSAGFLDIAAVEIDAKRGDLWVASSAPADGAGTLHRLQLVSGRPLRAFHIGADLEPVKFVDLAIGPAGAILVLDSLTPQLLVLRSGGTALERVVRIDAQEPVSVAVRSRRCHCVRGASRRCVANRPTFADRRGRRRPERGLARSISSGSAGGVTRLIAVQVDDDGSRHIIRLEINARGSAITTGDQARDPAADRRADICDVSGDELGVPEGGCRRRRRALVVRHIVQSDGGGVRGFSRPATLTSRCRPRCQDRQECWLAWFVNEQTRAHSHWLRHQLRDWSDRSDRCTPLSAPVPAWMPQGRR